SARSWVRRRSESTSALGQPSETNPTLGFVRVALVLASRKTGKGKTREHVARLALHLLLELREHLLALIDVGLHQALHRRTLHVHELRPDFLRALRVVAVELLRLLLQRLPHLLETLEVFLQVRAHEALHRAAVG